MKGSFILFFTIVFTVYGLVNFYIFIHGWSALPQRAPYRTLYLCLYLFFALSWIAGRVLENYRISPISDGLLWTGSFWLGAMVYFLFSVIIIDMARLLNRIFHYLPDSGTVEYTNLKLTVFIVIFTGVLITSTAGFINARSPVVNEITLKVNKKAGNVKELNAVLVSDIHLGTIIGEKKFGVIADKINSLNPDIILLAGDIVDEDIKPVIRLNHGETLRNLRSKYGTYGITGNHEYIGGVEEAVKYLTEHDVVMLRDTAILIDSSFYLAGREDRAIKQFAGKTRKTLNEIFDGIDKNLPIIVMNHQPFELDEAVKEGVDIHLSGHTHHGQLWPFNYITEKIYEISRGHELRGNTHFFVSNGAGTWGPPMRLGNRPEIVHMKIKFRN